MSRLISENPWKLFFQYNNLIVSTPPGVIGVKYYPAMKSVPGQLSILIVEDNPSDSFLIEEMLSSSALTIKNIYTAERLADALTLLKEHPISLVLLDLSLPDSIGVSSLAKLRELAQKTPIIILTGYNDSDMAFEALKHGAQDYLVKGEFNCGFLVKSIQYSIERKKVEEKVLVSEEKYRQIFYSNPFPMWISDIDTSHILEVNDAATKVYGYDRAEFLTLRINDIQKLSTASSSVSISIGQGRVSKHCRKNGDIILVEVTCYPINYFGRTAMQVQINDVTEKIKLQNELTLKKKQIIQAVLVAQENERKGIGLELHDNINQILSAIQLNLGFALEHTSKAKELIIKCMGNTSLAIEEIRKLSKALILPGNLKELGLVASIELLINDILPVTDIQFTLDADSVQETMLSEEQKINLYRIVQEQFNNILKHARCTSVHIHLDTVGQQVRLMVRDNGVGFDPRVARKGIGLTNIISRVELFNGKININSSPGHGCILEVVLHSQVQMPQEAA